jgi:hypothetical protein
MFRFAGILHQNTGSLSVYYVAGEKTYLNNIKFNCLKEETSFILPPKFLSIKNGNFAQIASRQSLQLKDRMNESTNWRSFCKSGAIFRFVYVKIDQKIHYKVPDHDISAVFFIPSTTNATKEAEILSSFALMVDVKPTGVHTIKIALFSMGSAVKIV